jgi:hypothetical protein
MTGVEFLFTCFSLFAAGFCVYFAWRAGESAEKAAHSEHRLAVMRGQVAGLEAAMMGLDEKHRKLAGRVYADEYWRGKNDAQPELQPSYDASQLGAACPNYVAAQQDGPESAAAKCKCSYCEGKRADRAARRAKLRAGVKS